jgi:hypothetical protein
MSTRFAFVLSRKQVAEFFSQLVFQMTVRMGSCRELASDNEAVTRLSKLYMTLEKSATPWLLMFPWFPGRDKKARDSSTKAMYEMLNGYVDMRRKAAVPSKDAIDILIAEGNDNVAIIGVRYRHTLETFEIDIQVVRFRCDIRWRYQYCMCF